jgi:hypothetical protein
MKSMPRQAPSFRHAALLVGLLGIGFVVGHVLKRQTATPFPPRVQDSHAAQDRPRNSPSPTSAATDKVPPVPLDLRSSDTLEDLLALGPDDLYERLALWLVDASTDDMAAYWNATKALTDVPSKLRDLLFVRWTIHDPLGAIQAAADTPSSHIPWWAWAKNDPTAAFEHALAHDRGRLEIVMRAIGQSDPRLALKILRDHPDLPQASGLDGILFGLTRDDPEAAVKLAFENSNYHDHRPMEAWIRQDPHAAFAWYLDNRLLSAYFSNHHDESFARVLTAENPDLLGELTSKLPDGALRRKFESVAFEQLLRSDPGKALQQARDNPSPVISTAQLSKIALLLANDDAPKARSLFAEILEKRPDFMYHETSSYYPNGASRSMDGQPDASLLIRQLVNSDPQETLQRLVDSAPPGSFNNTTRQAASEWVGKEPDAFAEWTATQPDPSIRSQAYQMLIYHMTENRNFESAIRYVTNLEESVQPAHIQQVLSQWKTINPEAADDWAEANGVTLND